MVIAPGYQQTEVGVIPEDWRCSRLGELTTKVGSGLTPRGGERVYKDVGRPFIRSQNVGWGKLHLDDLAFIDDATHSTFSDTEINCGDVLLNITGASIGRCTVSTGSIEGGNVNQHVCIIRTPSTILDAAFLSAFLLSNRGQQQVDSFQAGGNRQGLNFGQIRSFKIPLPPLPEQHAIAEALSDADALIDALDQLIAKKRQIKQGAMQQLLTGQTRLPGFSGEWEARTLGEIAEIVNGGTPSTHVPEYWDGGINWCILTDITQSKGKYLFDTARTISAAGLRSCSAQLLPKGTLLLCSRATVGELKIAGGEFCTNQGFKSLVVRSGFSNEFLYYVLLTMKPKLLEEAIGSTFLEVSKRDVATLIVYIPPLPEQSAIAVVLSDLDAEIDALEARRDKAKAIKQGMMQELLTGRIRLV